MSETLYGHMKRVGGRDTPVYFANSTPHTLWSLQKGTYGWLHLWLSIRPG